MHTILPQRRVCKIDPVDRSVNIPLVLRPTIQYPVKKEEREKEKGTGDYVQNRESSPVSEAKTELALRQRQKTARWENKALS